MKTSELTGCALDWAVARCLGHREYINYGSYIRVPSPDKQPGSLLFCPSTDWALAGPIIEREGIAFDALRECGEIVGWIAATENLREDDEDGYSRPVEFNGPTPLIAAMRCFVASHLGDEVEIPEELK